jgi:organic hydroperoxide reductase OsmC/OhrA
MQNLPHQYQVFARAEAEGNVALKVDDLPQLISAPPAAFGGPGDQWSPEHLLVAAVADCFVLTFRAVARASKLEWTNIESSAVGVLDRVDRLTKFTSFTVSATLTVPAGTDVAKAQRTLEKSETACLITNSLTAEAHLNAQVIVES